jgi:hypothetical protein
MVRRRLPAGGPRGDPLHPGPGGGARVAEWFKAPVLKFSKPRFVLYFAVAGGVDLSGFFAWLVLGDPRRAFPAQGSW